MYSHRQLFLRHLAQTSPEPISLEIESARGIYLKDIRKKYYIDLISGISVSNLGHRHPAVVRAIQKQMKKYMHLMVYGEYIQSPQVQLSKALTALLPAALDSVYFVNSGSEANEGAIKLAKRYTGRHEIIGFSNAYHGSTHGPLSLMGNEYFRNAFRPLLPGTRSLMYNDMSSLDHITEKTACVLVEMVQGEAGIIPGSPAFIQALRDKCTVTGTLLIADEVQTGMGRTGKMFGFEHFNIVPDIITLAKGFGAGMPLGAFISSHNIMQSLTHDPVLGHITTFGGHPVSCAAAYAGLKILAKEKYIGEVAMKEQLFREYLVHPAIKEIRSKGLMMAVDFGDEKRNLNIIRQCIRNGVITDWFLFNAESMRIAPPLIITEEEIRKACKKIVKAIHEVTAI